MPTNDYLIMWAIVSLLFLFKIDYDEPVHKSGIIEHRRWKFEQMFAENDENRILRMIFRCKTKLF